MTLDPRVLRSQVAIGLFALAWVSLLLALATAFVGCPRWAPSASSTLVLLDRSDSVPRAAAEQALRQALGGDADRVTLLSFAQGVGEAAPSQGTDLESALRAALERHAVAPLSRLVVVSDGHATQGQAEPALRDLARAGLRAQWVAVGRPPPQVGLDSVLAPAQAQLGQPVAVQVQTAAPVPRGVQVRLRARGPAGEVREAREVLAPGAHAVSLTWRPDSPGPWRLDIALEDSQTGQVLQQRSDAAVVEVQPRASLLYVQGGPAAPLADSLQQGGWPLQRVAASQLDGLADALPSWRALVLDEVAVSDASPRLWEALEHAVRTQGLGLLVVGGERAYARGGYRGSRLEALLPLRAEPAALDAPLSVLFAVDKSGSMGEGQAGVDRFALAQQAVVQAARGLGPRDHLGLLVFDAQPRLLLPLQPAAPALAALAQDWDAAPRGGTQLAPALQAALDELARAPTSRRLLVLVTDGFVADVPLAPLQAALAQQQVQTIALAVGPDADAAALRRLFSAPAGQVLTVAQAAEMPQRLRQGLERLRAPVEQGRIAVRAAGPLPFDPKQLEGWPDLAAYTVSRPQPGAQVALQSERGDPLIAHHYAGRGRVIAVASALGPWTPQWLAWRHWPVLAGGLAGAVAPGLAAEPARVQVRDESDALVVDVQSLSEGAIASAPTWRLRVDTPAAGDLAVDLVPRAPGRWQARVTASQPGLYGVHLDTPAGTHTRHHLRRIRAEEDTWGLSPLLATWREAGLIDLAGAGPAAGLSPRPAARLDAGADIDPAWLVAGLVLFLAGLLLDRWEGWATRWGGPTGLRTRLASGFEPIRRLRHRAGPGPGHRPPPGPRA